MRTIKIMSLLVFLLSTTACSMFSSAKVERRPNPRLNLPIAAPVKMKPVSFMVLTPENIETVFKKLEEAREELVLFGVNGQSYKNLSLNLEILKQYMVYQNEVIRLYKEYYERNTQQN